MLGKVGRALIYASAQFAGRYYHARRRHWRRMMAGEKVTYGRMSFCIMPEDTPLPLMGCCSVKHNDQEGGTDA